MRLSNTRRGRLQKNRARVEFAFKFTKWKCRGGFSICRYFGAGAYTHYSGACCSGDGRAAQTMYRAATTLGHDTTAAAAGGGANERSKLFLNRIINPIAHGMNSSLFRKHSANLLTKHFTGNNNKKKEKKKRKTSRRSTPPLQRSTGVDDRDNRPSRLVFGIIFMEKRGG